METPVVAPRLLARLDEIDVAQWRPLESSDTPFSDFEFLDALEKSGAVAADTGWLPRHLVLEREGVAVAAMPLYVKAHSYGEYLFDWDWANASQAFGVPYYPKIQAHVPFTPATGPKILVHRDAPDAPELRRECLRQAASLAVVHRFSQTQLLFGTADDLEAAEAVGWIKRYGFQYHWRPDGERDFAGYLERLKSRKRKNIVRERREATNLGLTLERWTGEQLRNGEAAAFFAECYEDTCDRRGGIRYLNRDFFERIFATMSDRITLAVARRDSTLVSAALYFHKGHTLFGRHWGTREPVPFLHFELCYYQGIELALERGARLFEAGAQGEHKIARGFLPAEVRAAYFVADVKFRTAIARYVAAEEERMRDIATQLGAESPFRAGKEDP